MKKIIILLALILIVLISISSHAQQVTVSTHAEFTVDGKQAGTTISYESGKQWALGIFYQSAFSAAKDILKEDTFYGARLQCPLVKAVRLSFFGTLRAGLVNETFIVVPGLETRLNIRKRFALAAGMGIRMNHPSVSTTITCKMF